METTAPCHLLLVDDHALIRAGIRAMVNDMDGYSVIGEAEDGAEAIELAVELAPDVVVLDISMKKMSGLDALRSIKQRARHSKVLVLSMHREPDIVVSALKRGADGYLLKDAAINELPLALAALLRGDRYLSANIVQPMLEQARSKLDRPLTRRQLEVLRLITRGQSTRSIAAGLNLSVKTVEAHRAQIMTRLQIHDIPSLVLYAVREGIISADD